MASNKDLEEVLNFLKGKHLDFLQPADQDLQWVWMASPSVFSSTEGVVSCYMNVVGILHLEAGFKNPLKDWELTMIYKRIQRELGKPPKTEITYHTRDSTEN